MIPSVKSTRSLLKDGKKQESLPGTTLHLLCLIGSRGWISVGKGSAVSPRRPVGSSELRPVVASGRGACRINGAALFHGDTSRMALFTSKRFAETRACHDRFPDLKGNIRPCFYLSQLQHKSNIKKILLATIIPPNQRALAEVWWR